VTEYGKSKLAAEVEALSAADQLHLVILRPAFIHGSGIGAGRNISEPSWPAPLRLADPIRRSVSSTSTTSWRAGRRLLLRRAQRIGLPRGGASALLLEDVGSALAGAVGDLLERGWLPGLADRRDARALRGARRPPDPNAAAEDWACDTRAARRDLDFTPRGRCATGP